MLFQNFSQAWQTFSNTEDSEKEKLADTHELYWLCREIWYEQQGDRLKARRKKKQP